MDAITEVLSTIGSTAGNANAESPAPRVGKVSQCELRDAVLALGSITILTVGPARAEGQCTAMTLGPIGVEVEFTPRNRPRLRAIVPYSNVRFLTLSGGGV